MTAGSHPIAGRPSPSIRPADVAEPGAFRGRRVIVTGARGFIGSHLVRRLEIAGADVHAVSRMPWPRDRKAHRTRQCDLRDADAAQQLVRSVQPDAVFHLAGHVSGGRDVQLVLPTLAANLQTTVNLLAAAAGSGQPRVVLAGSMEEPHPGEKMTTPSSPYAASKWASTAYAQMFHGLWALPTVVLRIAMAYGPDQPDERKLIPYVITSLLEGRVPALTSGEREIDWVYIDDVVEAFVAAATVPSAAGGVLDIGSGTPVGIKRIVEHVKEITGSELEPRFGALEDRRLDSARIAAIHDAAASLGWTPRVDLGEGLSRTVEWYRNRATSPSAAS